MRAQDLTRALMKSAKSGSYQLSVQVAPFADAEVLSEILTTWLIHNSACWSTPSLLSDRGLSLVPSPDEEAGPYHHDVVHPASPGDVGVDSVVNDFQSVFYGPGPIESIHSDATADDLRRLQQPHQADDQ